MEEAAAPAAPRKLGELLKTGLSLALDGLWQNAAILAAALLPGMLLLGAVTHRLGLTDKEAVKAALEAGSYAPLLAAAAAGAAAALLAMAAKIAVILSLEARSRGEVLSLGDAYSRAADWFLPFFMVQLRVALYVLGGLFLLIIPGIVFFIRYLLAPFAVLLEGRTGGEALARSKEIMASHAGKVLGNLIVAGLLAGLLAVFAQVFFSIAGRLAGPLSPVLAFASELVGKLIGTWALAVTLLLYKDLAPPPPPNLPDAPAAS